MKTLKVLLQEVVSGIKAWVNSNFAQESNTVHKTGNETVNGVKTFTGVTYKNSLTAYEDSGVSGYDYTPGSFKSVDTFIHRGVDHVYWGGLKHNWLSDGTSQTRFAVTNYSYINNTFNQGFWAVDLSASRDFATVELVPSVNYGINLGSSTKQWNNLYAKNYYYNGTAWGLDKNNVWKGRNDFKPSFVTVNSYRFRIKNDSMVLGTVPSSNQWTGMQFVDKNETPISEIVQSFQSNRNSLYQINVWPNEANSEKRSVIAYTYNSVYDVNDLAVSSNLTPQLTDTYNLGTTNNKWKSFNGVNPGALSLPNVSNGDPIDTNGWSLTGGRNSYTPTENGWFFIRVEGTGVCKLNIHLGSPDNDYPTWNSFNPDTYTTLTVPAVQGVKLYIYITADLIKYCRFYPCLGNV